MSFLSDYQQLDAVSIAYLIRTKQISSFEVLEAAVSQIEQFNPQINAVIYKMYDQAEQTLKTLDYAKPLAGVPFLLKDLLSDYACVPTSHGSQVFINSVPKEDSPFVKRSKSLGLIVLGKTNTPEFGLSSTTEPKVHGATRNPWNLDLSPGGSSGGAAAAVSARMVPIAHGGDAGGSLRGPAACCGLFGLKPTRDRIQSNLISTPIHGLVSEHVVTRTVRDSELMLKLMSQQLFNNSSCNYGSNLNKKFTIGFIDEPFFPSQPINSDNQAALACAMDLLTEHGHQIEMKKILLPSCDVLVKSYLVIIASALGNEIEKLSVRFSKKLTRKSFEASTQLLYFLGKHYSALELSEALTLCDYLSWKFDQLFQEVDIILTPSLMSSPAKVGKLVPQGIDKAVLELLRYFPMSWLADFVVNIMAKDIFAMTPFFPMFNMTGHPAASIPISLKNENQLPCSIQMVAPKYRESDLFFLAHEFENDLPWVNDFPSILRR